MIRSYRDRTLKRDRIPKRDHDHTPKLLLLYGTRSRWGHGTKRFLHRNGTRIEVVRKNVGQKRYAFNKKRYFLLPQLYRPPIDLCDDLET